MKKILSTIAALILCVSLASCENQDKFYGKNNSSSTTDSAVSESDSKAPAQNVLEGYDLSLKDMSQYIELGDYKNIKYEFDETLYEVSDAMIDAAVASSLELEPEEIKDRAVKSGDVVNIDFSGTVNNEKFDGCKAEGFEFIIGTNKFPKEFENDILGMSTDETKTIRYTFPAYYSDETIAGKEAVFEVRVNKISAYNMSGVTNELVKEKTGKTDITEYRDYIKSYMSKDAADQRDNAKTGVIINKILETSKIKGYDEKELNDYINTSVSSVEDAAKSANEEIDTYVKNTYGLESYAEYKTQLEEAAKNYLDEIMVIRQIAFNEKLSITDDEYKAQVKDTASQNGIEEADLGNYFSSKDIIQSMTVSKVQKWLLENNPNK